MARALVLGAGGTHAAFEVGVVRWLHDHGFQYDIVCGTSGGALNAIKLAEGDLPGPRPAAIDRVEDEWASLRNNADMWEEQPWLREARASAQGILNLLKSPPPVMGAELLGVLAEANHVSSFVTALTAGREAASALRMSPVRARLEASLNLRAILNSSIRLRLATVSLNSGRLHWVDNGGNLLDEGGQPTDGARPVNLIDAVMASAAIPVIFEPVKLNDEFFIDGGVREFVPVKAAVDMGATDVTIVTLSKSRLDQLPTGNLGGGVRFAGATALALNQDGRLEVFARGQDNALWHNWQTSPWQAGSTPPDWHGWASLGGELTSDPAVGRNADGALEVFVRWSDNSLRHLWQLERNGGWIDSWAEEPGVRLAGAAAVGQNLDGRLEVFVRRQEDDTLWHNWQTSPRQAVSGPPAWHGWVSLGGDLTSDPTVGRNANAALEVFARRDDLSMAHIWQVAPNGNWTGGWSAEQGVRLAGGVAVGQNQDGRLEVFGRGQDGALWHNWQTPNGPSPWHGWASLGGVVTSDPVVARNANGTLELFVRGSDYALYHKWQLVRNGNWTPDWSAERGINVGGGIAVAACPDGRLELFVLGHDNALWHKWQYPDGPPTWHPWVSLGAAVEGTIGDLVSIASRTAEIMANEIQEKEVVPGRWGNISVTLIRPTGVLPDSLTVDPGWITILKAYGYMRAFDAVRGEVVDFASSDDIIQRRLAISELENSAGQAVVTSSGLTRWPTKEDMVRLRARKRELALSVARRVHQAGDVPPETRTCWLQWERHTWIPDPAAYPGGVWGACSSRAGWQLAAETPPRLGANTSILPSSSLRPGVLTNFQVAVVDALLPPPAPVAGSFWIDDDSSVQLETNQYHFLQFEPGHHRVTITLPNYDPPPPLSFLVSNYPAPTVSIEWISPAPPTQPELGQPTTFVVHAKAGQTELQGQRAVTITNPGQPPYRFDLGQTVTNFVFRSLQARLVTVFPSGMVQVPNYDAAKLDLPFGS